MVKKIIPITICPRHGKPYNHGKDLIKVFQSRINTQRRSGNQSGGICFNPSLIRQLLNKLGNKKAYNQWIEQTLDSVYFELVSGKIVPLRLVEHLYLKEAAIPSIMTSSGVPLPGIKPITPAPALPSSISWYEVYIDYSENCQTFTNERVYLGDDLNLARGGIEDVTLDHVVPIRDILTDNASRLPYLTAISFIAKSVGTSSAAVSSYITGNISAQIVDELNLIVQKTRGIRICSGRVN